MARQRTELKREISRLVPEMNIDCERKPLSVTVGGEERPAEWEQGVGIWVPGHDINVGDRVELEGTPYRVSTMSRLVKESEPKTIIKKAKMMAE